MGWRRVVCDGVAVSGPEIRRISTTGGQPHLKKPPNAQHKPSAVRTAGVEPASAAPQQPSGRRLLPSRGASLSGRTAGKPAGFQPGLGQHW